MNNTVFILIFQLKRLTSSCHFHFKRNASNQFIRLFVHKLYLNIRLDGSQVDSNRYPVVLRYCSALLCPRRRFCLRFQSYHLRNPGRLRIGNGNQSAFADYADIFDFRSHFRKSIHLFGHASCADINRSRHDCRRHNKDAERRHNNVYRTHVGKEITDAREEAVPFFLIFLIFLIIRVALYFIIFVIYLIIFVISVVFIVFRVISVILIVFRVISVVLVVFRVISVVFIVFRVISVVFVVFRVISVVFVVFRIISVVFIVFRIMLIIFFRIIPDSFFNFSMTLFIGNASSAGRRFPFSIRGNRFIVKAEKFHRVIADHMGFSCGPIIMSLSFLIFFHALM